LHPACNATLAASLAKVAGRRPISRGDKNGFVDKAMSAHDEPLCLEQFLASGGRGRIDLLRHCVLSITMEPIFVFLVSEYRQRPTHAGALTLFDVFCAPGAPCRLRADPVLPPRELVLAASIRALRAQWLQLQSARPPAPEDAVAITMPMRGLFDSVVRSVMNDPDAPYTRLACRYDPALTPAENLPDGRMTQAQRLFVENTWKPVVRPRLVAAGFWQLQTIE
jgi:hypothetical protein